MKQINIVLKNNNIIPCRVGSLTDVGKEIKKDGYKIYYQHWLLNVNFDYNDFSQEELKEMMTLIEYNKKDDTYKIHSSLKIEGELREKAEKFFKNHNLNFENIMDRLDYMDMIRKILGVEVGIPYTYIANGIYEKDNNGSIMYIKPKYKDYIMNCKIIFDDFEKIKEDSKESQNIKNEKKLLKNILYETGRHFNYEDCAMVECGNITLLDIAGTKEKFLKSIDIWDGNNSQGWYILNNINNNYLYTKTNRQLIIKIMKKYNTSSVINVIIQALIYVASKEKVDKNIEKACKLLNISSMYDLKSKNLKLLVDSIIKD